MAWYNENGDRAPEAIKVTRNGKTGWLMNPAAAESWRTENGYTFEERPVQEPTAAEIEAAEREAQKQEQALAEFRNACVQFRFVCNKIGAAINKPNFRGGFDEMLAFQQAEVYGTVAGLCLAMEWDGADKLCTYLGSKIGLGQPQWWYACWEDVPLVAETNETESTPEVEPPEAEPVEYVDDLPELTPEEEIQE